jgi:hypothetical protein
METKSPFSQGAYSGATTPISCRVFPGEYEQESFGMMWGGDDEKRFGALVG